METDNERALKLFIVLSRASKVILEDTQKLVVEKSGLTSTEFGVLELVYHKGQQRIQDIGRKILLSSGAITYAVDKLEKKALVERILLEQDRSRSVKHISITQSGTTLIKSFFPEHIENIKKLLSGLDIEEQNNAIDLLRKLGLSIRSF